MKFEDKLMTLRKSKGWSQEDLANQIGVSRQTISKWEGSQTTPEMNKLKELSKIFEISVDELINDENKEDDEKAEEKFNENVFTKINLKSTNVLLIIASVLLVIGLIGGIILYRKSKDFNEIEIYVEDFVVITYELIKNKNIKVIEIYAFDSNEECIGINTYMKTFDKADYDVCVKEITQNKNYNGYVITNILLTDDEISWSSMIYEKGTKENILNERKEVLSNVQDLQIIDI